MSRTTTDRVIRVVQHELERYRPAIDNDRHVQRITVSVKLDRHGRPVAVDVTVARTRPVDEGPITW